MAASPTTGCEAAATGERGLLRRILKHRRNRRIVFAAGAGVSQRVLQLGSTFIVMPLLLRVLGAAQFGVWGAAASLAWLTGLVDLGTGSALVTLVARSSVRETAEEARRHVAGALGFGAAIAGLVLLAAGIAGAAGWTQGWAGPYMIAVIGLALNVPLSIGNNVWMALQEGYISGLWDAVQTVLTLGGVLVAAGVTSDVRVYVAIVYGAVVLANAGSLTHLLIAHPELRPEGLRIPLAAAKEVAGQGVMFFALNVAGGASFFFDNVLALSLLGPKASAQMTIAVRMCVMAVTVLVALSQPLWPAFAEAAESGDAHWVRRGLFRGIAGLVALTTTGSAILIAWGEPVLRWWLRVDLGFGKGMLWAVAAWVFTRALARVPSLLLNGLGIIPFQIAASAIATAVALGLKFVLAPRLGCGGILWGTTATMLLIFVPASLWRIRRWGKVALPLRAEMTRP